MYKNKSTDDEVQISFNKDFDIFLQNVIDMFDDDYYFDNKEIIVSDNFAAACKRLFYNGASERKTKGTLERRINENSI